jgi:hypothetical protein
MEADHGDEGDDTIKGQQKQAPSSYAGKAASYCTNLYNCKSNWRAYWKITSSLVAAETGLEFSRKNWPIFFTNRSHFERNNVP